MDDEISEDLEGPEKLGESAKLAEASASVGGAGSRSPGQSYAGKDRESLDGSQLGLRCACATQDAVPYAAKEREPIDSLAPVPPSPGKKN